MNASAPIEKRPVFLGTEYAQNGEAIDRRDMMDKLEKEPAAADELSGHGALSTTSLLLSVAGGFLVGWPIGQAIGGQDKPLWVLAGVGGGLIALSIPFAVIAENKVANAVDAHNRGVGVTLMTPRESTTNPIPFAGPTSGQHAQSQPGATRQMFSEADAYEQFMGRWSRLLARQMVVFSGARDGDAVLDVGSGTGALSFAVHDATKASRVTGIDLSPEYVSAAQKSADSRVQFEVGDAQALKLKDAAFDRTLSMLVINFIPDPARALMEMRRVTKPGGVVAAAVWDYGDGMQMLRTFWDEATALDPAIEPRDEKHMPLCKQGELAALWNRGGLKDVQEVPLTATLHFTSFDDYWAPFLLGQGPAGAYVSKLPKERQVALRERLRKRLLGGAGDRAIEMQARAWAVKGTVP